MFFQIKGSTSCTFCFVGLLKKMSFDFVFLQLMGASRPLPQVLRTRGSTQLHRHLIRLCVCVGVGEVMRARWGVGELVCFSCSYRAKAASWAENTQWGAPMRWQRSSRFPACRKWGTEWRWGGGPAMLLSPSPNLAEWNILSLRKVFKYMGSARNEPYLTELQWPWKVSQCSLYMAG